jgi:hypothetical protein
LLGLGAPAVPVLRGEIDESDGDWLGAVLTGGRFSAGRLSVGTGTGAPKLGPFCGCGKVWPSGADCDAPFDCGAYVGMLSVGGAADDCDGVR